MRSFVRVLFFTGFFSALCASALDTNWQKFFNHEVSIPSGLPADRIYPQGQLFPFTFYSVGGGSEEKRGELLPAAERESDQKQIIAAGVTMIGPQYELNDESIETARKFGVQVVYTLAPTIDGEKLNRKWLLDHIKEHKKLDEEKIKAAFREEIRKVVKHKEIAWWNLIPEELRFWRKEEMRYMQLVYELIREEDPMQRPVFMYEPGHRSASALAKLLPWQDLSAKGMYMNYSGHKTQRAWARHSMLQQVKAIEENGRKEIVPISLPEMFQQPADEELPLIPAWVRHDVYCTLLHGAKGVMVFSASKRKNFAAREAYLQAYLEVCRELTGPKKLGQVFLFGKEMQDLECVVIDGPENVSITANKEEYSYPSLSFKNYSWQNMRYLFVVNSSNEPVKAMISGLVYGSGVTVEDLFNDKASSFTAPEGDIELSLKALETVAYRVSWKKAAK